MREREGNKEIRNEGKEKEERKRDKERRDKRERVKGVSAKSGARKSERRAWQRRRGDGEGCWFEKGRIKEEGLRIVQPKNTENRERESQRQSRRERVGP